MRNWIAALALALGLCGLMDLIRSGLSSGFSALMRGRTAARFFKVAAR